MRFVLRFSLYALALLAATGLAVGSIKCSHPATDAGSGVSEPQLDTRTTVTLWVWDQKHDLSFLDPNRHRAAVYAGSVWLEGDGVSVEPRRHGVVLSDALRRISVVRLEVRRDRSPSLSNEQVADAAEAVLSLARLTPGESLQIDFDATRSQRQFYRLLLENLERRLPAQSSLSIAALASWCLGDSWIDELPIDEAVPMLYRMGPESSAIRAALAGGRDFTSPLCRVSVGVSTDEPIGAIPSGRHVFVFGDRPWTLQALQQVAEATGRAL